MHMDDNSGNKYTWTTCMDPVRVNLLLPLNGFLTSGSWCQIHPLQWCYLTKESLDGTKRKNLCWVPAENLV